MDLKFGFKDASFTSNKEFRDKLVRENSRRFIFMLFAIAISQLVLLVLEFTGVISWVEGIYHIRLSALVLAILFALTFIGINKINNLEKRTKTLSYTQTIFHLMILSFGSFFTIYVFSIGVYSFTIYVFATLLVSITHTRWPYVFNAAFILSFIFLFYYIWRNHDVPYYYIEEAGTVVSLGVLISLGNLITYKIRWNAFLKEKEIAEMNLKLVKLSEIDELTGLYNRRRILEEISEAISRTERYDEDFCVALLDLDYFKKVNDKYGHNVGDDILRKFSEFLKANLRESDVLGRWGGEEFIIITPNTKKDGSFVLIDRIREKVESKEFDTVGRITFSAGISEFSPEHTDDMLIGNADEALYQSKNMGRNIVSVYSAD